MRHAIHCALFLALAGCSPSASPLPSTPAATTPAKVEVEAAYPRLAVGSSFMVANGASLTRHWSGRDWTRDDPEFVDSLVLEGDRGLVLEDKGFEDDDERPVKVRMESGQKEGRSYLLERKHVLPLSIPRP